jgi:hypothetical protein
MAHILPGITTVEQHRTHYLSKPEDYRPDCCPHCGKAGIWRHGRYTRQADREHGSRDSLNPVSIPRFLLSFLPQNMFNITRMHCAGTLVSMAYSTGCSGNDLE